MSEIPNGTTAYRLGRVEEDVLVLQKKIDRLMWATVTLAFSITSSAIVLAITVTVTSH